MVRCNRCGNPVCKCRYDFHNKYVYECLVCYEDLYPCETYDDGEPYDDVNWMPVAKALIDSFCESEFGLRSSFDDPYMVPLAYTELGDDNEIPVQVYADLVRFRLVRYEYDECTYVNEIQYDSLKDLCVYGLTDMDFEDLVFEWIGTGVKKYIKELE